jgi:plastocyanin
MTGTLKVTVTTATLPEQSITSTVTAANQVTFVVTENNSGQCVYPTPAVTNVHVGTKIIWLNMSNDINPMVIHNGGPNNGPGVQGINHEGAGHAIGATYEQTPTGTGTDEWYCHAKNDPMNLRIVVTP